MGLREVFDFAVIGGGIVGLGAAWAAAKQGASVLLIEANDYASALPSAILG